MINCKLFEGLSEREYESLLKCLCPTQQKYAKGEIVVMQGGTLTELGVVVSGTLEARGESSYGDSVIISRLSRGDVIGEALCASGRESPVTVFAAQDCEVMFIAFDRIMSTCSSGCDFHKRLISNLTKIISLQYFILHERISCLMLKSLKNKIMEYLLLCAKKEGKNTFNIPFDRDGLASYLGCDRSALSRELSRLKAKGVIDYYKNTFKINN